MSPFTVPASVVFTVSEKVEASVDASEVAEVKTDASYFLCSQARHGDFLFVFIGILLVSHCFYWGSFLLSRSFFQFSCVYREAYLRDSASSFKVPQDVLTSPSSVLFGVTKQVFSTFSIKVVYFEHTSYFTLSLWVWPFFSVDFEVPIAMNFLV